MSPEKQLFWDLMETYDRNSRPVLNANTSVQVNFAVALNQIMDLDEKNQILTTSLWVFQNWKDYNLHWDPRQYKGIKKIVIPAEDLWLPDVYIFNNADEGMTGFVNVNGSKALVNANGRVKWTVPMIIKSACVVRVMYFPFDYQLCQIKFGSWIYDGYQLELTKKGYRIVDLSKYVTNSEFDLLSVEVNRVTFTFDCCSEPYHQLHLNIRIRRKALYYTYTVIAPSILLCILTMSSFLLPCDCGEKVAIGMTVFLAIYFLQMLIADNIPESNATPLVGIFLTMVMTLNSMSLIMATCIMNLKKRGERKRPPPVPRWVMKLCKKFLAKITCTKFRRREDRPRVMLTALDDEDDERTSANSMLQDEVFDTNSLTMDDRLSTMRTAPASRLSYADDMQSQDCSPDEDTAAAQRFRESLRRKALEIRRQIKYEWSYVADVIDSFLFLLYMLVSVITIVIVLVIMPHIHEKANMESEDQILGGKT